jgi:hypothetical protein
LLGKTPHKMRQAAVLTCCICTLLYQDGIHPSRLTGALLVWLSLI